MCPRKLLLILILFFSCDRLLAATFTVTSNADSGPGTLRQALLDAAANGTATMDMINFNLIYVNQASITITVQTQLPDVTANVIIDGTTQPGLPLGVSDAKIIITPATPAANLSGLNVSNLVGLTDVVTIYGLYIDGFSPNQQGLGNGIITNTDCVLTIGAPGKGNVISGNNFALSGYFQNAVIQSNFIGLEPDGETVFNNVADFYAPTDYNNLLIGGATLQAGNVIIGGGQSGLNFGTGTTSTTTKSVLIENNLFNTDYKGTNSRAVATSSCILANDINGTFDIVGNVFSASEIAILGVNKSKMVITGNFFGTDRSQTFPLGSGTQAIENSDVDAVIGGTTAAAQNIFTNYQNPIVAYNNSVTEVVQNSFYCNAVVQLNDPTGINFIRITSLTNNSVGGDAPPGATVQLYYVDTKCTTCNPRTWFANVTANTNGAWQYTGSQPQNIVASSTVNNNTVGFQIDSLSEDEATVVNYDCQHAGSITLKQQRQGNLQFVWTNSSGKPVGNSQNISNLQPGTYTLQLSENGTCPSVSGSFTITDLSSKVFGQSVQLDCSTPTATFTTYPSLAPGVTVTNYYWKDAQGTLLSSTNTVSNLTAGNYYLYITDSNGCNSNTALIQVLPAVTPPVINDTYAKETDAQCGLANGSVTGITLTNAGDANYGWSTVAGVEMDFGQLNLTNAPAGQYYFFVYYDFNCPPVKSRIYTINDGNVITLNDSLVTITKSTCNNSNGGISGITTTGAITYQWYNSDNAVVSPTINLSNAPPGNYYLVASNTGCAKQSPVYTIGNIPAFDNFPSTYSTVSANCNLANGAVSVSFTTDTVPVSYRWTDSKGRPLAKNGPLENIPAGTYLLYVTDSNGCESLYGTYAVGETQLLSIDASSAYIVADQCLSGNGSIGSIHVTGGVPPYSYTWLNSSGNQVGDRFFLTNLQGGVYTLQVRDSTKCGLVVQQFTVPNQTTFVAAPVIPAVQICNPGQAIIAVTNPLPGYGYHLYATQTSTDAIGSDTSGIFAVTVSQTGSFYVTQYTGDCESARVQVNITISSANLSIPNTFTPNDDGINDYWVIKGLEPYPNVDVQIFTRYGQKVFESKGYSQPFNGNYGNSKLPPGVYYYIVNLNSNCSLLSGSLTLIR